MRLIVGGQSVIGSCLYREWSKDGIPCRQTTRRRELVDTEITFFDLSSDKKIPAFFGEYASCVICAGITKVAFCEKYPEVSRRINVDQTLRLIRYISLFEGYVLLLSTSQVFDDSSPSRKPEDAVRPANEYGFQKADLEKQILESPRVGVLRLTKVIHENDQRLLYWRKCLESDVEINPFENVYISPIALSEVITKIGQMVYRGATGIHHLPGGEEISYADYARRLCDDWGLDRRLIKPIIVGDEKRISKHNYLEK